MQKALAQYKNNCYIKIMVKLSYGYYHITVGGLAFLYL